MGMLLLPALSLGQTHQVSDAKHLDGISLPSLPSEHLIRYLNTFPKLKQQLTTNLTGNGKTPISSACWGHERDLIVCSSLFSLRPKLI